MSRKEFAVEKGIEILAENADVGSGVRIIKGTGLPGGDAGQQDDAPIGSLYIRQNGSSSTIYQKIANAGASGDWQENGSSTVQVGTWRGENVVAVTNDTVTAGVARDLVASPFADDEGTLLTAADFQVGDFIIADADGTPVLLEVTNVSAPNVTFSTPASAPALAQDDTFVARNYLPDSPGDQEGQAIAHFNGSVIVKLGDVDWNFATGINLSSGYTPASGDVSSADSVESAIEKLDGNNDAQDSALGLAQGATNFGTFAGDTLSDNADAKTLLGELENAVEGSPETQTGVASATVLDSLLVDVYRSAVWLVTAFDEAAPADSRSQIVHCMNNGTAAADATNTDDNIFSINKVGGNFNQSISCTLTGTGAAQVMNLVVNTTEPGVTYTAVLLGSAPSGY